MSIIVCKLTKTKMGKLQKSEQAAFWFFCWTRYKCDFFECGERLRGDVHCRIKESSIDEIDESHLLIYSLARSFYKPKGRKSAQAKSGLLKRVSHRKVGISHQRMDKGISLIL